MRRPNPKVQAMLRSRSFGIEAFGRPRPKQNTVITEGKGRNELIGINGCGFDRGESWAEEGEKRWKRWKGWENNTRDPACARQKGSLRWKRRVWVLTGISMASLCGEALNDLLAEGITSEWDCKFVCHMTNWAMKMLLKKVSQKSVKNLSVHYYVHQVWTWFIWLQDGCVKCKPLYHIFYLYSLDELIKSLIHPRNILSPITSGTKLKVC